MPTTEFSTKTLSDLDKLVIRRMVECNLNAAEVARRENYSESAIRYHIRKIQKITGCDIRTTLDAVRLYEAVWHGES